MSDEKEAKKSATTKIVGGRRKKEAFPASRKASDKKKETIVQIFLLLKIQTAPKICLVICGMYVTNRVLNKRGGSFRRNPQKRTSVSTKCKLRLRSSNCYFAASANPRHACEAMQGWRMRTEKPVFWFSYTIMISAAADLSVLFILSLTREDRVRQTF